MNTSKNIYDVELCKYEILFDYINKLKKTINSYRAPFIYFVTHQNFIDSNIIRDKIAPYIINTLYETLLIINGYNFNITPLSFELNNNIKYIIDNISKSILKNLPPIYHNIFNLKQLKCDKKYIMNNLTEVYEFIKYTSIKDIIQNTIFTEDIPIFKQIFNILLEQYNTNKQEILDNKDLYYDFNTLKPNTVFITTGYYQSTVPRGIVYKLIKINKKTLKLQRAWGYTYNRNYLIDSLQWSHPQNISINKFSTIRILDTCIYPDRPLEN